MRTILLILSGLLFATGSYLLTRLFTPDYPQATGMIVKGFTVVWGLIAGINMLTGVLKAGYGWGEELTLLLLIFALPVLSLMWIVKR